MGRLRAQASFIEEDRILLQNIVAKEMIMSFP